MTLRLAMVIDGDASGAKRAAGETRQAIDEMTRSAASGAAAFDQALGGNVVSLQKFRDAAQGAGASLADRINAALGIGAPGAGSAANTYLAQYGADLDGLRAKFNPLYAAGQQYKQTLTDINNAYRIGALSEAERAAAVSRTKDAFASQVLVLRGATAATGEATRAHGAFSTQALALSHVMRSTVEQLALGVPPTQILAQQINHLSYAATGPGGLSAALGEVGSMLKSGISWLGAILTPARLAAGGILAFGAAALTAAAQYGAAQRQMQLSLTGAGRASGFDLAGLNAAAQGGASTFGFSVSEAREFAGVLAATGKIGREQIAPLVALGHDFATAYGVDAAQAAKMLAQAMLDPAKGAAELNQRLGFLDAATAKQIADLQAQNRLYEAQQLLIEKLKTGLDGVSQSVSSSANFFTALGNKISNAWTAFGEFAARATGIGFVEADAEKVQRLSADIADLQKRISEVQGAAIPGRGHVLDRLNQQLQQAQAEYDKLTAANERYWQSVAAAQARQRSFAPAAAINATLPELNQLSDLRNRRDQLAQSMIDVQTSSDREAAAIARTGHSYEELARALNVVTAAEEGFQTAQQKTLSLLDLQIKNVGARSPAALAEQARQRALIEQGQTGETKDPNAVAIADKTALLAYRQAQQQIIDAEKQRTLSAAQRVESAQLELSILGRSATEQDGLRAKVQARQQLEQEALRTYGSRDAYDRAHLAALEKEIDRETAIKQRLAEQQAMRDATFARQQIGRSSDEQQVAATLRGIYGDRYGDYQNSRLAQTLRTNADLQFGHDTSLSLLKDFNSELRQGKQAGEAFGDAVNNALGKVQDRLVEMIFNDLWNRALGGASGGGGLSLLSFLGLGGGGAGDPGAAGANPGGGFDTGGWTGMMSTRQIAGVVHGQEFVVKAGPAARHRALLEALNDNRIPGYAGGGFVGPPPLWRAGGGAGIGSGGVEIHLHEAAGVETRTQRSKKPDGGERIDLIQVAKQAAVQAIADGNADPVNRARYGTSRVVARR